MPTVNPVKDRALIEEYATIEGSKLGLALPGGAAHFITLKESSHNVIATPSGPSLGVADNPPNSLPLLRQVAAKL